MSTAKSRSLKGRVKKPSGKAGLGGEKMNMVLQPNSKIKLPSERLPSTIDKQVICRALGLAPDPDEDQTQESSQVSSSGGRRAGGARAARGRQAEDEASRDFLMKTAQTLRLEFRQILKVRQGCSYLFSAAANACEKYFFLQCELYLITLFCIQASMGLEHFFSKMGR